MVAPRGPLACTWGHEADLVLARLRLHGVEGLLQLLVRNGLDVLLEGPVPQVDEAAAENPSLLPPMLGSKAHELKAARRRSPPPARALSSATPF